MLRMTLPVEPALRACFDPCRRMHRRHDPTYYWATRRLPAHLRPATHALYGYVRMADELVDGPARPGAPEARRRALGPREGPPRRPPRPGRRGGAARRPAAPGSDRARRRRGAPRPPARGAAPVHVLDAPGLRPR